MTVKTYNKKYQNKCSFGLLTGVMMYHRNALYFQIFSNRSY